MNDLSPAEQAAIAAAEQEFHSAHSPAHNTASSLAVSQNGNIPAGWVSPDVADAAEREIHRQAILAEQAQAANAAVEAEITNRINQSHGVFMAAGVHALTEDEANNG